MKNDFYEKSKKKDKVKYNRAFTLAEVLITLSILGVVAAITIPNLIQNYKKSYTISRLKQAYSLVTEATRRAEILSGTNSDNWDKTNLNIIHNYFVPQLNITYNCHINTNYWKKACIGTNGKETPRGAVSGDGFIKIANNNYQTIRLLNANSFILKNGMSIGFMNEGHYKYIQIVIDIDGPDKGPNQRNKDIFYLFITNAQADTIDKNPRFHPYTVEWSIKKVDYNYAKRNCTNYSINTGGDSCFAYIILSGWKIPDDYPEKF